MIVNASGDSGGTVMGQALAFEQHQRRPVMEPEGPFPGVQRLSQAHPLTEMGFQDIIGEMTKIGKPFPSVGFGNVIHDIKVKPVPGLQVRPDFWGARSWPRERDCSQWLKNSRLVSGDLVFSMNRSMWASNRASMANT